MLVWGVPFQPMPLRGIAMYRLILVSALALPAAGVPAQRPAWFVEVGLSGEQVAQRTAELQKRGYRPVSISAYNSVEANRFAVIYRKGKGPQVQMDWGQTPDDFSTRAKDLYSKGYRPVCVSGCNLLGAERLSDVWEKSTGGDSEINRGLDGPGLAPLGKRMNRRGYRPVWISSYMVDSANTYAIIQEKSSVPWELKYNLSAQQLQDAIDDLSTRGYRPISIGGLNAGGVVRYCAVWEKRKGPAWQVYYGQTQDAFIEQARAMAARGYRPIAVTGFNTLNGDRFVSIWEKE
jgi:hypothetical protein